MAGKPLGEVLADRVWSKVGMPDTSFVVPADKRPRLAKPLPVDPITGQSQTMRILSEPPKFDVPDPARSAPRRIICASARCC